ncbi:hypothetical protein [Methanohalophilus portucalensis]|uniref:Uncharacterized protein n=2 Tax=Methanohalophilus portucalensis TaxID=39664 RepID=A0A1L9C617_9EURY|nr:hypothetical protein [Methanohalophilus portucalensis]ATU08553.1 hypothetical protein BKM01_07060 [Methanohalophilus portucalensis]OJH49917.1 hypothetical protein MPF_0705 [Methanohalophilus portucalensis FDF-1]RNI13274.1 hypothetical protein EFE41_01445 [Methanohalophilus portucalensis FDF-1]SMH32826.1 hypothetical protein SAMN06264941_0638 [Methanohalophilus portucalensis FDF-1]
MPPDKGIFQIIVLITTVMVYVAIVNLIFHMAGGNIPIYAPGTLVVALLGYVLGTYLYSKIYE